jgi:hypothetical protein
LNHYAHKTLPETGASFQGFITSHDMKDCRIRPRLSAVSAALHRLANTEDLNERQCLWRRSKGA